MISASPRGPASGDSSLPPTWETATCTLGLPTCPGFFRAVDLCISSSNANGMGPTSKCPQGQSAVRSQNQIARAATLRNGENLCGRRFGADRAECDRGFAQILNAAVIWIGADRGVLWRLTSARPADRQTSLVLSTRALRDRAGSRDVLCRFAPRVAMVQTTQTRQ